MTKAQTSNKLQRLIARSLTLTLTPLALQAKTLAQGVIEDPSLGTVVTPNGTVYEITGGRTVGDRNVFHSFSEFGLPSGSEASFLNDLTISNIFARVTGGSASNIDGLIRAQGSANLFLINPNGITFGRNAQLNLGGSFVATTANALQFPGGAEFSMTSPVDAQNSLLTVNPSAFLFNQITPAPIVNNANTLTEFESPSGISISGLRVPDGNSLLLVGGYISMDGGRLNALGGRIELTGLASSGTIRLRGFTLDIPERNTLANITLSNDARIGVRGAGGGDIVVNANQFTATDGGRLVAGIDGTNAPVQGGNIIVNANTITLSGVGASGNSSGFYNALLSQSTGTLGDISIVAGLFSASSEAMITNNIDRDSTGKVGNLTIEAGSFSLTSGAQIDVSTYGEGDSGNINLIVNGPATISGFSNNGYRSSIFNNVGNEATGSGGDINITARSLLLVEGAQLDSSTYGRGRSGNINLMIDGSVAITGFKDRYNSSGIFNDGGEYAVGDLGTINIQADSLLMENQGMLAARNYGTGNSGTVNLRIQGLMVMDATGVGQTSSYTEDPRTEITTAAEGVGRGGDIMIHARTLVMRGMNAVIDPMVYKVGKAGNALITVDGAMVMDGARVFSSVAENGIGNGGNVEISAQSLDMSNGALISVNTFNRGNGGNAILRIRDSLTLSNASIQSSVNTWEMEDGSIRPAVGDSGEIQIYARSLLLTNGGQVFVNTRGQGDAGRIFVQADSVTARGRSPNDEYSSGLFADTYTAGKAGNIEINTKQLTLSDRAQVSAFSNNGGEAGNILVNADLILLQNSDIETEVLKGNQPGGNIVLTADAIVALGDSDILAYSQEGPGGTIRLNTQAFIGRYNPAPTGTDPDDLDGNNRVDINASGTVPGSITLPENSPMESMMRQVPANLLDSSQVMANSCMARDRKTGRFYITGTGGLPSHPGGVALTPYVTGPVRSLPGSQVTRRQPMGEAIREPQGLYRLASGELLLSSECPQNVTTQPK